MRCEKCGAYIDKLYVNMFNWDGSDSYQGVPIVSSELDAAIIETNPNWTGYELTEEEMTDTIHCPRCNQFPFEDKEIQIENVVRVIMFRKKPEFRPANLVVDWLGSCTCSVCTEEVDVTSQFCSWCGSKFVGREERT